MQAPYLRTACREALRLPCGVYCLIADKLQLPLKSSEAANF